MSYAQPSPPMIQTLRRIRNRARQQGLPPDRRCRSLSPLGHACRCRAIPLPSPACWQAGRTRSSPNAWRASSAARGYSICGDRQAVAEAEFGVVFEQRVRPGGSWPWHSAVGLLGRLRRRSTSSPSRCQRACGAEELRDQLQIGRFPQPAGPGVLNNGSRSCEPDRVGLDVPGPRRECSGRTCSWPAPSQVVELRLHVDRAVLGPRGSSPGARRHARSPYVPEPPDGHLPARVFLPFQSTAKPSALLEGLGRIGLHTDCRVGQPASRGRTGCRSPRPRLECPRRPTASTASCRWGTCRRPASR